MHQVEAAVAEQLWRARRPFASGPEGVVPRPDDLTGEYGWIAPDGAYYTRPFTGHIRLIAAILRGTYTEL